MKIKELIYKTPEITEEKLLEEILNNLKLIPNYLRNRIRNLHKLDKLEKSILLEYDLIQDKKSYLTKSQREQIVGFVGLCMIKMVKNNGDN